MNRKANVTFRQYLALVIGQKQRQRKPVFHAVSKAKRAAA